MKNGPNFNQRTIQKVKDGLKEVDGLSFPGGWIKEKIKEWELK